MKSTLFTGMLCIVFLTMLFTATSGLGHSQATIAKGELAPEIILESNNDKLELSNYRGENVLLTFWSSSDAKSRVECNKYDSWMKANETTQLRHIAINFDEQPALFEEIIRRDNFDATSQFHAQGKKAQQIMEAYNLNDCYGSVLIGPDGHIIDFNPSSTTLAQLLKK